MEFNRVWNHYKPIHFGVPLFLETPTWYPAEIDHHNMSVHMSSLTDLALKCKEIYTPLVYGLFKIV